MNVVSEVLREQLELIFKVWGTPAEFAELTSKVMMLEQQLYLHLQLLLVTLVLIVLLMKVKNF